MPQSNQNQPAPGDDEIKAGQQPDTAADPEVETTTDDIAQQAIAAFDEGEAEASGDDGSLVPAPPVNERAGDEGDDEGDEGDDEAGDDGSGGEETPEQKAAREKLEAAKAAEDAEVKALKLHGKTEQRFRELSGKVRELSDKLERAGGDEVIETVAKLGGKQGLALTIQAAQDQFRWDEEMARIGAKPEQFATAVGIIAAANSNDENAWREAREVLVQQLAHFDQLLGKPSEHYDPLKQHPDLQERVRKGELDEADAQEMAALRDARARAQQEHERQQQEGMATEAQRRALADLSGLGAELKKRDGEATFTRKMAILQEAINEALVSLPPDKWVEKARAMYEKLALQDAPAPQAPPAQRPRPGKQPVRVSSATTGAAGGGAIHPSRPVDPVAAFDQGVQEAREAGL